MNLVVRNTPLSFILQNSKMPKWWLFFLLNTILYKDTEVDLDLSPILTARTRFLCPAASCHKHQQSVIQPELHVFSLWRFHLCDLCFLLLYIVPLCKHTLTSCFSIASVLSLMKVAVFLCERSYFCVTSLPCESRVFWSHIASCRHNS